MGRSPHWQSCQFLSREGVCRRLRRLGLQAHRAHAGWHSGQGPQEVSPPCQGKRPGGAGAAGDAAPAAALALVAAAAAALFGLRRRSHSDHQHRRRAWDRSTLDELLSVP